MLSVLFVQITGENSSPVNLEALFSMTLLGILVNDY